MTVMLLTAACGKQAGFDAQGTFEATEVVVSSEAAGRILYFDIQEGEPVRANETVGAIDSVQLHLQRGQLSSQLSALLAGRPDTRAQVAALREQIGKQKTERKRVENMLRDGAATRKQLDDIEAQIRILEGQLSAAHLRNRRQCRRSRIADCGPRRPDCQMPHRLADRRHGAGQVCRGRRTGIYGPSVDESGESR